MIEYVSKDKYDLITLTCDVVNHILEENELELIFKNIFNMLNDDGFLICDILDKEQ